MSKTENRSIYRGGEYRLRHFPVPVLAEPLKEPQRDLVKNSGGEARESTNIKPADLSEPDSRGGESTGTSNKRIKNL
jgi:hypothetical protein